MADIIASDWSDMVLAGTVLGTATVSDHSGVRYSKAGIKVL